MYMRETRFTTWENEWKASLKKISEKNLGKKSDKNLQNEI